MLSLPQVFNMPNCKYKGGLSWNKAPKASTLFVFQYVGYDIKYSLILYNTDFLHHCHNLDWFVTNTFYIHFFSIE